MKSPIQSESRKPSTSMKNCTAALWSGECRTTWLIRSGRPSQRSSKRDGPRATSAETSNGKPSGLKKRKP